MKAHLKTTDIPLTDGTTQTADCGKEIAKARIVFMWDEQEMGHGIAFSKNICNECWLSDQGPRTRKLVYGITDKPLET